MVLKIRMKSLDVSISDFKTLIKQDFLGGRLRELGLHKQRYAPMTPDKSF